MEEIGIICGMKNNNIEQKKNEKNLDFFKRLYIENKLDLSCIKPFVRIISPQFA
jgi:hypothetical protein